MDSCECACVRACVRACVLARNQRDTTPGSQDSSFLHTLFLYLIYLKPNTSFPPLGRVTDWSTPSCFCWEDLFRCGDEVIYGCRQVRRLSVVNSRPFVSARITTHKKSPKTPGNALFNALIMSGFQISTTDATIENHTWHSFFSTDSGKKSAPKIPDFCRKACQRHANPGCVVPVHPSQTNTLW